MTKAELDKKFIETKIKIIQSKLDKGKVYEAQFEVEPLYNKFPANPKVLTIRGFTDLALQNNQRAIESLIRAHKLEKTAKSALNLSSAYIAAKNFSAALKLIDHGIEIAKKDGYSNLVRLYHNKGLVFERTGDINKAIDHYKQALYHSPGYVLTIKRLAKVYELTNQKKQAEMAYKRFHYACNACYLPVQKLATFAVKRNNLARAEYLLKSFLDLDSTRPEDRMHAGGFLKKISTMRASNPKNSKKEALEKSYSKRFKEIKRF